MNYPEFIRKFDSKLEEYRNEHRDYIQCKAGCSSCCEKGDYPISAIELEYLMQGYAELGDEEKRTVQNNIKNLVKGGVCPFLINKQCSIYQYRPIICRVHGLAYMCRENTVKVPFCVHDGKNYSDVYENGEIMVEPIKENLDTTEILRNFEFGEIRNLAAWLDCGKN